MVMEYHATENQILTFWKMLADRKWDQPDELIDGRAPRRHYLVYVDNVYRALQDDGYVTKSEMSAILDDLSCFKGWEIARRLRGARAAVTKAIR